KISRCGVGHIQREAAEWHKVKRIVPLGIGSGGATAGSRKCNLCSRNRSSAICAEYSSGHRSEGHQFEIKLQRLPGEVNRSRTPTCKPGLWVARLNVHIARSNMVLEVTPICPSGDVEDPVVGRDCDLSIRNWLVTFSENSGDCSTRNQQQILVGYLISDNREPRAGRSVSGRIKHLHRNRNNRNIEEGVVPGGIGLYRPEEIASVRILSMQLHSDVDYRDASGARHSAGYASRGRKDNVSGAGLIIRHAGGRGCGQCRAFRIRKGGNQRISSGWASGKAVDAIGGNVRYCCLRQSAATDLHGAKTNYVLIRSSNSSAYQSAIAKGNILLGLNESWEETAQGCG